MGNFDFYRIDPSREDSYDISRPLIIPTRETGNFYRDEHSAPFSWKTRSQQVREEKNIYN